MSTRIFEFMFQEDLTFNSTTNFFEVLKVFSVAQPTISVKLVCPLAHILSHTSNHSNIEMLVLIDVITRILHNIPYNNLKRLICPKACNEVSKYMSVKMDPMQVQFVPQFYQTNYKRKLVNTGHDNVKFKSKLDFLNQSFSSLLVSPTRSVNGRYI